MFPSAGGGGGGQLCLFNHIGYISQHINPIKSPKGVVLYGRGPYIESIVQ